MLRFIADYRRNQQVLSTSRRLFNLSLDTITIQNIEQILQSGVRENTMFETEGVAKALSLVYGEEIHQNMLAVLGTVKPFV